MNSTVTFPINTRVCIIAGTHRGKSGIVGNGKPTTRNTGKIEVLVGCKNASIWCKPEWLQSEEKCCSDLHQLQNLQVSDLSDASKTIAAEVQEVLEEIEGTTLVKPDVQVSPLLPRQWKVGDRVRTAALKYPPTPSQEVIVVKVPTSNNPEDPGYDYTVQFKDRNFWWYRPEWLFPLELAECLQDSVCSPGLADLTIQQGSLESKQPSLLRSNPSANDISKDTSQASLSTTTSAPLIQREENGKLCMEGFLAKTCLVPTPLEEDLTAIAQDSGGKCSELSYTSDRNLLSSRMSPICVVEDLPKLSTGLPKAGMWGNGSVYALPILERPILGNGCLLLPTPMSYSKGCSARRPGQSKLDQRLRLLPTPTTWGHGGRERKNSKNGQKLRIILVPHIREDEVLNPAVPMWMMGFPTGFMESTTQVGGQQIQLLQSAESHVELTLGDTTSLNASAMPSFQELQRSPLEGYSTSTLSCESASLGLIVGDRVKHRFSSHEGTVIPLVLGYAFILWEAHPEHETLYKNEDLVKLTICENFPDGSLSNGKDTVASAEIVCPHDLSENFPKPGKAWIDPHEIDLCAGTQSRDRTDWETVQRYSELMKENLWDWEREPRPVVFQDKDGCKYPGDCHHRTEAAIKAGVDLICVDLRLGSLIDAIMFSCVAKANREHGLPLTAKDQRRRIELFLETRSSLPETDERRRYSSREIGKYLSLSESGYRTIVNIINEREMLRAISQFTVGDRVQVVRNAAAGSGAYWPDGTLGKVQELDKKKGILIVPDTAPHLDKWMLSPVVGSKDWIHPDNLIKSDAPWLSGKISQNEESERYESLETDDGSVLPPQLLVREPKSRDKQLLPNVNRNGDVPLTAETPMSAALVNKAAIANGKPDVVAAEIAIGIRHLSPEQLAWVLTSSANNGLSDDHLKAVIKAGKQILNLRHHPEYFPTERKITQRGENMPSQCTLVPHIDFNELHCLDDEDLTLGVGDEGVFLDDGDEGVFSDDGNFWLEEAS